MPTLALESMALCKPIVVSNDAGCVESVDGGKFGHIYEIDELDDLVSKTNRALHGGLPVQDARQRVLNEYDWRVVAAKLDDIYRG